MPSVIWSTAGSLPEGSIRHGDGVPRRCTHLDQCPTGGWKTGPWERVSPEEVSRAYWTRARPGSTAHSSSTTGISRRTNRLSISPAASASLCRLPGGALRTALWQTVGLALLLLLGLLALYAVLAIRGASRFSTRGEGMSQVITATRRGQSLRVGEVETRDELAELAQEFDAMLDRIEHQTHAMQQWAEQLKERSPNERPNCSRNDELQRTITVLRETRRQLVVVENSPRWVN